MLNIGISEKISFSRPARANQQGISEVLNKCSQSGSVRSERGRTDGGRAIVAVGSRKQASSGAEERRGLRQLAHTRHRPAALYQAVGQRPSREADADRRYRRQQRHLRQKNNHTSRRRSIAPFPAA